MVVWNERQFVETDEDARQSGSQGKAVIGHLMQVGGSATTHELYGFLSLTEMLCRKDQPTVNSGVGVSVVIPYYNALWR